MIERQWCPVDYDLARGFRAIVDSPMSEDMGRLSFLPGVGRVDTHGNTTKTKYYHANQIGTTRAMTDDGGDDEQGVVYTAFGERVGGTDHRYGYAGAWGYRSHDDFACEAEPAYQFPYLHVGWRYYDPASGRFLQRDPIGIRGDLNVYEYVRSNPLAHTDPFGLACGSGWTDTVVPDTEPCGASFEGPCQTHDDCYGTCGSDKDICDENFRDDMITSCGAYHIPDSWWCNPFWPLYYLSCLYTAEAYYNAVVDWGCGAYDDAQDEVCPSAG